LSRPAELTAVVTGAGRGIGRTIAEGLAARGIEVIVAARNEDQINDVAAKIVADGGRAIPVAQDLSTLEGIGGLALAAESARSTPLVLINAAGVFGPLRPIAETPPEEWLRAFGINVFSTYLTTAEFLPGMIGAGWGRILNVTSAASLHFPGPLNSAYATSKVAINQFTRHVAAETDGTGVTANVFHPGDVQTAMFDDIRSGVRNAGDAASANMSPWVEWMQRTGGDPAAKALDLVVRVLNDERGRPNGEFLWIDDPLQPPIPSWSTEGPPPSYTGT
jgi:NAD(P)-dependent dehydrogenase (short-subunit alcohol dehydrogenase family)